MTDRLYYTDAYRRDFDASVLEQLAFDGRTGVCLDHTAFYPTSGGQPFDVGWLNGMAVTEVIELEDGRLLHVIGGAFARGPA